MDWIQKRHRVDMSYLGSAVPFHPGTILVGACQDQIHNLEFWAFRFSFVLFYIIQRPICMGGSERDCRSIVAILNDSVVPSKFVIWSKEILVFKHDREMCMEVAGQMASFIMVLEHGSLSHSNTWSRWSSFFAHRGWEVGQGNCVIVSRVITTVRCIGETINDRPTL